MFHHVFAGITALFACFPILHLALGLFFLLAPAETFDGGGAKRAPGGDGHGPVTHGEAPVEAVPGPERQPPPPREEHASRRHSDTESELFAARLVGGLFTGIAATIILAGWTIAALAFAAGRNLSRRRRYRFCFGVAALECIVVPLGTILGAFTLVVLTREGVRSLFGVADAESGREA